MPSTNHLPTAILIAAIINLFAGLSAFADASYELSCRNKAKELAAESYKSCVTENRQSQLQQIRSDYKEKLAELKSHYDNELKKMSGKQADSPEQSKMTQSKSTGKSKAMRSSGARNLPKKTVRTEVIDLTTPAPQTEQQDEVQIQSQNRLKTDTENSPDLEIVELPTQE